MYIIQDSEQNKCRQSSYYPEYDATQTYTKASIGRRFLAWVIDGFIELLFITPLVIWIIKMIIIAEDNSYSSDYQEARIMIGILLMVLLYIVLSIAAITYFLLKDGFKGGQSVGKRVMGLKVISLDTGTDCDYKTSLIRNVLYILVGLIPIVGQLLDPIMICVREDGRRVGDLVANTVVVNA